MSKNQRPQSRRRARRRSDNSFMDKLYYYIVGALLIILALLIAYIYFSSQGAGDNALNNRVNITETDFLSGTNKRQSGNDQQDEDNGADTTGSDESANTESDAPEELDENVRIADGEIEVKVQKDASTDTSYVPDFSDGSADMDAIERGVAGVVGVDPSSLNAIWIGNDGPGRIKATYANSDYSEQYVVYFRYNNGVWYITDYQKEPYQPS